MNARLAARLTGWKIDIQSDTEFAQAEAEVAFGGGGDEDELSGRCAAILANGKRCPNASLPGSRFCGVPAHQELEGTGSDYVGGKAAEPEEAAGRRQVPAPKSRRQTIGAEPEKDAAGNRPRARVRRRRPTGGGAHSRRGRGGMSPVRPASGLWPEAPKRTAARRPGQDALPGRGGQLRAYTEALAASNRHGARGAAR